MTDPREFIERRDDQAADDAPDADGHAPDGEVEEGPDTNDLEADNAAEHDTIETVDPDNAPA